MKERKKMERKKERKKWKRKNQIQSPRPYGTLKNHAKQNEMMYGKWWLTKMKWYMKCDDNRTKAYEQRISTFHMDSSNASAARQQGQWSCVVMHRRGKLSGVKWVCGKKNQFEETGVRHPHIQRQLQLHLWHREETAKEWCVLLANPRWGMEMAGFDDASGSFLF